MIPERAHNLFIRTRAKNGFKLPLTNFKISELETRGSLQSKRLITRRSLVQIQPRQRRRDILHIHGLCRRPELEKEDGIRSIRAGGGP